MHSLVVRLEPAYAYAVIELKRLSMWLLVLGLFLFLGIHGLRIGGDGVRDRLLGYLGPAYFKMLYSLVSALGLTMLICGFGVARDAPIPLWTPPPAMKHVAYFLTLVAMVLMVAAYVPRNAIKAKLHHPMVLSVKTWALAHVLSNGNLAHLVLFGSILLWSVLLFKASRVRDKRNQVIYASGSWSSTVLTLEIGIALWLVLVAWAHGWLIGVQVLP
jgi:uncharacterized membrane protein